MLKRIFFVPAVLFTILFIGGATLSMADDLDDGISKFTDDGVSKYDELGKPDKNISYIVQNAKSRAAVRAKAGTKNADGQTGDQQSGANMNSVIMGPGGSVRGDIVIIDQSKGDKTQVVE
ncbi:MAG: hypothetical protein P8X63_14280 [Desulfuromonadaceae bacterium]|jgi:hypothetical protein